MSVSSNRDWYCTLSTSCLDHNVSSWQLNTYATKRKCPWSRTKSWAHWFIRSRATLRSASLWSWITKIWFELEAWLYDISDSNGRFCKKTSFHSIHARWYIHLLYFDRNFIEIKHVIFSALGLHLKINSYGYMGKHRACQIHWKNKWEKAIRSK